MEKHPINIKHYFYYYTATIISAKNFQVAQRTFVDKGKNERLANSKIMWR